MYCMNAPVFRITCRALRRAFGLRHPHPATYSCGLLCSFTKPSVRQGIITGRMASHQANSHKRSDVARELKERLVWVDLEMTGLDINKHHILEMACLITDGELNLVAEGQNIIIHQPDEVLNNMNNWCVEHHRESGLTEAVKASKVSLQMAEYEMLSYVREHTAPGFCPLAGNSVHADKVFLEKYMPQFMKHLHYRIVDVSTIKELCRRWYPEDFKAAPDKKAAHRALDDIKESIKELKFYRNAIFK